MLSKFKVQHYKSLFDTEIELEPLTVFIGPNGSGKSNICEALVLFSFFFRRLIHDPQTQSFTELFDNSLIDVNRNEQEIKSKFWQGKLDFLAFEISSILKNINVNDNSSDNHILSINFDYSRQNHILSINFDYSRQKNLKENLKIRFNGNEILLPIKNRPNQDKLNSFLEENKYHSSSISKSLEKILVYDFIPKDLSTNVSSIDRIDRTGKGITTSLVDILHENRESFDELEERLTKLIPNIKRISLPRGENQTFELELIDKYSEHHIPATDVSHGTLKILGFLTALYEKETPSIICFEELENGVHP
jgi:AAA15 family ATPase/GTPase